MVRRGDRIAHHDVADARVADGAGALRQRLQDLAERQHPDHAPLLHDDERSQVLLRHGLHRVHRAARRLDGEQPVALHPQDLLDLHADLPWSSCPSKW